MGHSTPIQEPGTLGGTLRELLSYSTYLGLVPPPGAFRPIGVSAMTLVRNEQDWVETSVASIVDQVDEVLVADNGSVDSTRQILESLEKVYSPKVRFLDLGDLDFVTAVNTLITRTRYRWLLRWHGDFVARSSGALSMRGLIDRVSRIDPLRHFCIGLAGVALDGDLEHQFKDRTDAPEHFLYTYSPWLHYVQAGRWEELHIPWFYEKLTWTESNYFHMRSVKSSVRLLQKWYQGHWFRARGQGRNVTLEDFILERSREELGTDDMAEAARRFAQRYFADVVPFNRGLCGEYPEALLPALRTPPFKLVVEGGKVVERLEYERFRPRHRIGQPKVGE